MGSSVSLFVSLCLTDAPKLQLRRFKQFASSGPNPGGGAGAVALQARMCRSTAPLSQIAAAVGVQPTAGSQVFAIWRLEPSASLDAPPPPPPQALDSHSLYHPVNAESDDECSKAIQQVRLFVHGLRMHTSDKHFVAPHAGYIMPGYFFEQTPAAFSRSVLLTFRSPSPTRQPPPAAPHKAVCSTRCPSSSGREAPKRGSSRPPPGSLITPPRCSARCVSAPPWSNRNISFPPMRTPVGGSDPVVTTCPPLL